jgi:hypothetical protein
MFRAKNATEFGYFTFVPSDLVSPWADQIFYF